MANIYTGRRHKQSLHAIYVLTGRILSITAKRRTDSPTGPSVHYFNSLELRLIPALIAAAGDADLADYPDDAFDYVVLSQTLQATRHPRIVLEHMLRIGRRAVVSFPDFGHWRIRLQLLFGGRMPQTDNLPDTWYDTPNIHFCTIKDFRELCGTVGVKMERALALDAWGRPLRLNAPWWFWNLFGEQAVFLLSRKG